MLEPSVHITLGDEDTSSKREASPPAPVPQSSKSSEDVENMSKFADRSSMQKSMLSLSNRSMMTNSSMLAPALTNMNSISHISILQGITPEVTAAYVVLCNNLLVHFSTMIYTDSYPCYNNL